MSIKKQIIQWWLGGIDPLWNSLLAQYDFNAPQSDTISHPPNSDNYDDVLYGYESSSVPGGTLVAGLNGYAVSQSVNSNCYLKTRALTNFSFVSGGVDTPFTIEVWLKLVTGGAARWICGKRGATTEREYDVAVTTGNLVEFSIYKDGGVSHFLRTRTTGALTVGAWYHLVLTYDGSATIGGMKTYFNGVSQAVTSQGTGTYTNMTAYSTNQFLLGNSHNSQTNAWQGLFDQFSIWSRLLSQTEVTALYNNGTPRQYRVNQYTFFETKYKVIHRHSNYIFASDGSNLLWSEDNGATYYTKAWGTQYSGGLPIHDKAVTACNIFDNGDVMFCTAKTAYYSTDGLVNINTSTVLDKNGDPYVFHTPSNATRPGPYFYQLNKPNSKMYVDGSEVFVWINYTNSGVIIGLGASPTVVWATFDNGQTIKEVYTFGQNTNYRDDGSVGGGSTGTLLGDSGNSRKARHGHSAAKLPSSNVWYTCTGDANSTDEVHWMKHEYSAGVWTTSVVLNDMNENSRWKAGKIDFISQTDVYFASDATNSPAASEAGLMATTIANLGVSSSVIFDITNGVAGNSGELVDFIMSSSTGKILVTAASASYLNYFYIGYLNGSYTRYIVPNTQSTALLGWAQLQNGYFTCLCSSLNAHLKTLWIKD